MRANEFVTEEINPDVLDPRFSHKQKIGAYTFTAELEPDRFHKADLFVIRCYDHNKMIGQAKFYTTFGDSLVSALTTVQPEYQKTGIASTMYAYARMLGNTIEPSASQLPTGKKMWKAWKKSGEAKHLMKEEPTRIKLGNNNAAQAWIEKVYAKYPHTMQNNHVMVWGSGDDQQFAMFELVPSFSKRGAVEVKWIQAYPLRAGVGSRAMQELQALAREDGISLTLFPWDKGQVSQSKLTKFYRGQGFKPTHKGGKAMQWEPQESVDESRTEHPDHHFKTAYHITTTENAEEILYGGLDPRDGKAFMVVDEGDQAKLQDELSVVGGWMYAKTEHSDDALTLLQIDVSGIPLTYEHGWYFATTKIPPGRITDLGVEQLARYV